MYCYKNFEFALENILLVNKETVIPKIKLKCKCTLCFMTFSLIFIILYKEKLHVPKI